MSSFETSRGTTRIPNPAATAPPSYGFARPSDRTLAVVTSGSTAEAVCALGAAVLAVLGLAGVSAVVLAGVCAITLGAALLCQGSAIAARFRQLFFAAGGGNQTKNQLGVGMAAQIVGGTCALVLGTLALVGVASVTLLSVVTVILGLTLIASCWAPTRLEDAVRNVPSYEQEKVKRLFHDSVRASSGAQVLFGIGAVILGIMALFGTTPLTLILVSMLAVSASLLISGATVGTRLAFVLNR
jgi:hypothetical protein